MLICVKSLRVRSTNLDERVQVSHSFVIQTLEIDLPPRAGGGTGGYDSIPKLLLDLWVFGELEEGEGQRVGTEEIDSPGNVIQVGLVTAHVRQRWGSCETSQSIFWNEVTGELALSDQRAQCHSTCLPHRTTRSR